LLTGLSKIKKSKKIKYLKSKKIRIEMKIEKKTL